MVTRLRSGERSPGRALAVRIAAIYQVPVDAWDEADPEEAAQ
jgi:transcriptional regulator with XRE-family HTH domain